MPDAGMCEIKPIKTDCRLDSADPKFRAVTTALVTRYQTSHDDVVKLASLMGVIYRRCRRLSPAAKRPGFVADRPELHVLTGRSRPSTVTI